MASPSLSGRFPVHDALSLIVDLHNYQVINSTFPFQYAYGWLTQWAKMNAYVLNLTDEVPKTIKMPSITLQQGVDLWIISHHDVPLKVGELEFLRMKVDDPIWRYQGLRDFIDSFKFPKLTI
jgi:hypothetical protein